MFDGFVIIFIYRMLPVMLRTLEMRQWLFALLDPFQDLFEAFQNLKILAREEVHWNGQTIVLEHALNYHFPEGDGGYYIVNGNVGNNLTFIYQSTEGQKRYIYLTTEDPLVTYIYQYSEHLPEFDFTVMVPTIAITDGNTEDQIRAFVDLYKLAGKRYNIIIY